MHTTHIVINGTERADEKPWRIGERAITLNTEVIEPFKPSGVRIVFDSDLNRDYQNMPCCIRLKEERFKLPKTLIKDFDIILTNKDGHTETHPFRNIHTRFLKTRY